MKYILQVFTGSWRDGSAEAGEIVRKIGEISRRIRVDKVIIGWNTDPAIILLTSFSETPAS